MGRPVVTGLVALLCIAMLLAGFVASTRPVQPRWTGAKTALDLIAMTNAELARVDPVEMDLIVARGIPELAGIDIGKYRRTVDQWAAQIAAANKWSERYSKDDPTYKVSREFWMAGGMAVALAGPSFGIKYTAEELDPGRPEQQFVHGVIDKRRGTCATMPVLYLGIAHRLGWPMHAVVSGDHMWTRWDDGRKGGQRFNLEATNSKSDGGIGSFSSPTDAEYAKALGTPDSSIRSGSDLTSLTPRQMLGVFIQGRAGYWAAHERWDEAERDLLLAVSCFPENRDLQQFLANANGHNVGGGRHLERASLPQSEIDLYRNAEALRVPTPPPNIGDLP
jgi:hypothetical protein